MQRSNEVEGARMSKRIALGVLASVGCLWASVAYGECNSSYFNPSPSGFCNGCRYESRMVVTRDTACERPYRPYATGRVVEIVSNRVVQRARHGIAGASSNTFAYKPEKGYVGPDEFVVEAAYRQDKE